MPIYAACCLLTAGYPFFGDIGTIVIYTKHNMYAERRIRCCMKIFLDIDPRNEETSVTIHCMYLASEKCMKWQRFMQPPANVVFC